MSVDHKQVEKSQLDILPELSSKDKFSFFFNPLTVKGAPKNIANMGSRYRFNRMREGGWGIKSSENRIKTVGRHSALSQSNDYGLTCKKPFFESGIKFQPRDNLNLVVTPLSNSDMKRAKLISVQVNESQKNIKGESAHNNSTLLSPKQELKSFLD